MKIKFLGTAAAEGVPAISCSCPTCTRSREKGGRNIRSRSQALINGDLLIELNSDTFYHTVAFGLDLTKINDCLITHSHGDHLYTDEIENYRPDFCHGRKKPMRFYADKSGYDKINEVVRLPYMKGSVSAQLVSRGERFTVCDGKYDILPMRANHAPLTDPLIYSISDGEKKLLYAHDTGYFPEETWELLRGRGYHGLVSLDCTGCLGLAGDWVDNHMSFRTVLKVIDRMKKEGIADEKTVLVVNHFSHNNGQDYDEMSAEAQKHGIIVTFDGLELEF